VCIILGGGCLPRRRKSLFDELVGALIGGGGGSRRRVSRGVSARGKGRIIEALRRSRKVRREDVVEWLNRKHRANLPKSASWAEIEDFIRRKVSVSSLEGFAKRKGVI